jgi:hypothetical protein
MNLIAQHKSVRSLSVFFFFFKQFGAKKNIKIDGKWTKVVYLLQYQIREK